MPRAKTFSEVVEAEGHLIDSGVLSGIMDKIIEVRGSYEILNFDIGRTNDDPSRIEMRINAVDTEVLDELLQQLTTFGAHPLRERDVSAGRVGYLGRLGDQLAILRDLIGGEGRTGGRSNGLDARCWAALRYSAWR